MTQVFRAKQLGGYGEAPEHVAYMEPTLKEVRVVFGGETIARSRKVLVMHETKRVPVYYFPMSDVRMELLVPTDRRST